MRFNLTQVFRQMIVQVHVHLNHLKETKVQRYLINYLKVLKNLVVCPVDQGEVNLSVVVVVSLLFQYQLLDLIFLQDQMIDLQIPAVILFLLNQKLLWDLMIVLQKYGLGVEKTILIMIERKKNILKRKWVQCQNQNHLVQVQDHLG